MKVLVIDREVSSREVLVARLNEALRLTELRRTDLQDGEFEILAFTKQSEPPNVVFLGPGCYQDFQESIGRIRAVFPTVPIALVIPNDIYALEAVELRRITNVRIIAIADIAQMAQYILDCDLRGGPVSGGKNRGVVTVTHAKGGVGATTVAAAMACCWASQGLSAVLVDLDDVNPQLTAWARVPQAQKKAIGDMVSAGEVIHYRTNEILHHIEGYDRRLAVVGQPEYYRESFHFKADIIEGAPSIAEYMRSLISALQDEFDIVIIDTGNSWGIASFAALTLSQRVLMVVDDDGMSLYRSLRNLKRFYRESDDPDEFDLSRWSFVCNAYTGKLLSLTDFRKEVEELDIFPDTTELFTVPFSSKGRQWGAPGTSFYDLVDDSIKSTVRDICFNIVPFRQEESVYDRLRGKLKQLVGRAH